MGRNGSTNGVGDGALEVDLRVKGTVGLRVVDASIFVSHLHPSNFRATYLLSDGNHSLIFLRPTQWVRPSYSRNVQQTYSRLPIVVTALIIAPARAFKVYPPERMIWDLCTETVTHVPLRFRRFCFPSDKKTYHNQFLASDFDAKILNTHGIWPSSQEVIY